MTAKDSANEVLGYIAATGASAAWNIANFMQDGCRLTYAGANLQWVGNVEDGAGPLYASNSGPVFNGRPANDKIATTQIYCLLKENANQIKEGYRQTVYRKNKRAEVAKWTVSETAAARATGKLKRVTNSDDVLGGCCCYVAERTRRDLDKSDDE